jgi:hypothetical protein
MSGGRGEILNDGGIWEGKNDRIKVVESSLERSKFLDKKSATVLH